MSRWCNTIHQPSPDVQIPQSPTPISEEHVALSRPNSRHSPEELEKLHKYKNFMNNLSTRAEGGWLPPNTLLYDEDLLRHTLRLSPRVAPYRTGSNTDFYPDSERNQVVQTLREGALKRVRFSEEIAYDSEKKLEFDQDSFIHAPSKGPLCRSKKQNRRQGRQHPEDAELPFQ